MGSWTRGGLVKHATAQFNGGVVACVGRENSGTTAQFNGGWGRGHVVDWSSMQLHSSTVGSWHVWGERTQTQLRSLTVDGVVDTWWIGQACNCTVQRWGRGMCGERELKHNCAV